jgi:hypothetical protein
MPLHTIQPRTNRECDEEFCGRMFQVVFGHDTQLLYPYVLITLSSATCTLYIVNRLSLGNACQLMCISAGAHDALVGALTTGIRHLMHVVEYLPRFIGVQPVTNHRMDMCTTLECPHAFHTA